jgi:RimJ/RimL family protein N-acetyltransferase
VIVNPPGERSQAATQIREFREADAEAVARMWRESASAWPGGGPGGGEHSTASRVRQDQRDLNTLATLVAFAADPAGGDERAVGYCSLFEYTGEVDTAYVGTLSAHPEWHGKGVGRDLLRAALARTVELGYSRLDLNTWAGNLKAVPLYKKSGYFWVPDTTVKMENYLPLIFRLPAAREFFATADWYRDFKRDLSLRQDDEKRGNVEVYTYRWERDARHLEVVIDRRARGIAAISTQTYAASIEIDDPRLPVGGTRAVTWRLENRGARPVGVSVLAEGEDAVRCTVQRSGAIERGDVWSATATAEQPQTALPPNRPSNRVKSTVIVDGQPVQLVAATQVVQPVSLEFGDRGRRFLHPGVTHSLWLHLDNALDQPVDGILRLSATPGLQIDRKAVDFSLEPRSRVSHAVRLRADRPGSDALRAQAVVNVGGAELRTRVFSLDTLCGDIGELFVEQTDEYVRLTTDRVALYAGLKPTGDWMARVSVFERESGTQILSHAAALGPPFVPSVFTNSTWTPRVARRDGALELSLSTSPDAFPGLTFERHVRLSPSGVIKLTYRATNAGNAPRTLQVNSGTSVSLGLARRTETAALLNTGLVVEDSSGFPDWTDSEAADPARYAESWMAEFGDGWVGATIWTRAREVQADWSAPDLVLDLGTIEPGASVETDPIYVYAGQGDWKTARALWRHLAAPDGSREPLDPRPAHRARMETFAFAGDVAETTIVVESERTRALKGEARLQIDGSAIASAPIEGVRLGVPACVAVRAPLPSRAAAVDARIAIEHARSTEMFDAPLLRVGIAGAGVHVQRQGESGSERVEIENGRLRLVVLPDQMARVVELSVLGPKGEWQNQLHSPASEPGVFVWFNPWYGGIHPALQLGQWYPGRLTKERFTWRETERVGAHGIHWRGIECSTVVTGADWSGVRPTNGLRIELSYLLTGQGNVLAVPVRVVNEGGSLVDGSLTVQTFLQPGGRRDNVLLHYERDGHVRTQKRVHGRFGTSSEAWCAVSGSDGSPAIAVVPGALNARVAELRDMGLEGAHPVLGFRVRLAPGESLESVGYIVLAEDVDQARLYRTLRSAGQLV